MITSRHNTISKFHTMLYYSYDHLLMVTTAQEMCNMAIRKVVSRVLQISRSEIFTLTFITVCCFHNPPTSVAVNQTAVRFHIYNTNAV